MTTRQIILKTIEQIEKQFFSDRQTAKTFYALEYFFTTFEDAGHIISIDCKYVKPQGISYIINHPLQPSDHYISFQELDRHCVSCQQFNRFTEKKKREFTIAIVVPIKESGYTNVSLNRFANLMMHRNYLMRVMYKNDEPVFSESLTIKSHTRLVVLTNT